MEGTDSDVTGGEGLATDGQGPEGHGEGLAAGGEGLDRILTVPNLVTLVRLACIPLYVWLLFGADRQTAAAVLLGALGATDWVDGYVARRFHQVSTLGKVLDPVADRVLVLTAVITHHGPRRGPGLVRGGHPGPRGGGVGGRPAAGLAGGRPGSTCCGWARRDVRPDDRLSRSSCSADGTGRVAGPVRVAAWVIGVLGLTLAWVAAASYIPVARDGPGRRDGVHRTGGTADRPTRGMTR